MMAVQERPETGPATNERPAIDPSLDAMVLARMRPVTLAAALLFVAFSIYNHLDPYLGLGAAELRQLTASNIGVVGFFAALYALLRRGSIAICHAHCVVCASVVVVLANTLHALWLLQDLFYTHYLVVTLMGVGSIVLSARCHAVCLGLIYAGWLAIAYPVGGPEGVLRYSFVLFAAGAMSTAFMVYRVRSRRQLTEEIRRRQRIEEELSRANERLEELSQRDPLTNLLNRRGLFERLDLELSRIGRGHVLALLLVDLDGFKEVNDSHGHIEGDRVLLAIAEALRRATRTSDAVCRWGGDEFVVVLSDTREEDALQTAERLVACVRDVGMRLFPGSPVTASGGLTLAKTGEAPLDIIERADQGVYNAKRGGGNQVHPAA